ncbi:protease SohB [Halomonas garicola]|uniref:protease SohB n=1 Tax=Halomonas garicola TaxID=1690008 RepID=UPI00289A31D8|nr:protease SohB [Halomonas garicola]
MGEWIINIVTFLIQAIIVIGLGTLAALLFRRGKSDGDDELTLHTEVLNEQRDKRHRHLDQAGRAPRKRRSRLLRALRPGRRKKAAAKADDLPGSAAPEGKTGEGAGPRVWVLDFHGDLQASATEHFAEEVSAVIRVAGKEDDVVVRLESGGGLVHAYGLAAAELERLTAAGLTTTVCIDKVAASGGYLMACSAGHIKAAPFAVIGSIGVVAQVPNVHRLLKRHDVDVELLTAGKHKRTLTMLGENTEEGRAKFIEDLENTHRLFKDYVAGHRPAVDIEALATGEIWYGSEALKRELVDSVQTSEAYLVERMADARVISVWLEAPRRLSDRLGIALARGAESAVVRGLGALSATRWHRH